MRIVFLGPPGSGKGTQASLLAEQHGLCHISTGVIIRRAIEADTALGREAARFVDNGRLVPDEVVRTLAEAALADCGYDDFALDGYPRTVVQARWLDAFLEANEAPLHRVFFLHVPDDHTVDRLSKRRVHKLTGENFHLDFKPPPSDVDPALIVQRVDDRPHAIRKRLEVYWAETDPVVEYYKPSERFCEIDGVGGIDEIHERLEAALPTTEPRTT